MNPVNKIPKIIQGGMGAGISNWRLAKAVSTNGGLGIVAGTALDQILVRRLQDGDREGHMRRALEAYPFPAAARSVLEKWYQPCGNPDGVYRLLSKPSHDMPRERIETMIIAAFVEVFLAREGHEYPVGFNCLEKMQLPLVPSIFGAMLAGAHILTIGAGLPVYIPMVLDRLISLQTAVIPLHTEGKVSMNHSLAFIPDLFVPEKFRSSVKEKMKRPLFFPIISSALAGKMMTRNNAANVDGFIVENHFAGGHNAPPRKNKETAAYGTRDEIDINAIAALGKPFWLAGGFSSPGKLSEALQVGASGIQIGSLFAYSAQSGLDAKQKAECLTLFMKNRIKVRTDFEASPTGYPFKTVLKQGTATDTHSRFTEQRKCDLGYLCTIVSKEDGSLSYHCPATDSNSNALCVCNGLMSAAGWPQSRNGKKEPPLLTCGDDYAAVGAIASVMQNYTVQDVLDFIHGKLQRRLSA